MTVGCAGANRDKTEFTGDDMKKISDQGVSFMTFESLAKHGIKHCFSTKLGGVSKGVYESMNLGFGRGDADENVHENFSRMAAALGVDKDKMCLSQQTHTTNVRVMTAADAGNGIVRPLPYKDVDGMITNVKGMTLVTFYADCVPLFFYDPVHEAIGLSHSGWRGTVGKIGKHTIELMGNTFGSKPEDILCCVGPSICRDCYEVSADVVEQFETAFGTDAVIDKGIVRRSVFHPGDENKFMLDLWKANELVFLEAGIDEKHIEITDYCTHCKPELFYSHRIMGTARGSLAAFMCL